VSSTARTICVKWGSLHRDQRHNHLHLLARKLLAPVRRYPSSFINRETCSRVLWRTVPVSFRTANRCAIPGTLAPSRMRKGGLVSTVMYTISKSVAVIRCKSHTDSRASCQVGLHASSEGSEHTEGLDLPH